MQKRNSGFTMIEMIVVMFLIATMFGIVGLRLVNISGIVSVKSPLNTLITDMKSQQLKAMIADTEGSGIISDYGIHFTQTSYTLFRGTMADANKFTITLTPNIIFSPITFPSGDLLFAKGSGEMVGFVPGQSSVTILNTKNGEQKTITINRYGVVAGVN